MAVTDQTAVDLPPDPSGRRPVRVVLRALAGDPRPYLWLLAIAAVAPETLHQLLLHGDAFVVDLHVYRLSGTDLLHHRAIYSWYYQTQTATLPFTYPPIAAVLSVPVSLLPVRVAAAIWFLGVYACLAWVLRLVLEPTRARLRVTSPRFEPLLLPVVWVVCTRLIPGLQQIHLGQVGAFLLALVALDLLTPRTGRWRGVLTGLAAAIKLTPLVFIVVFVAARRFRDAALTAASFVVLAGLVWAVAPASSQTFWTDTVVHSDRLGNNADPTNQSLRGVLLRTSLHGLPATAVLLVVSLVILAAGLLVTTQAHRDGDPLLFVTVAGFLSCLLSPVSWIHHYVWVFLLLAWLLRERRVAIAVGTAVVWGFDLAGTYRARELETGLAGLGWKLLGDEFFAYAAVLLAVLTVRAWRRADGLTGVREMLAPGARRPRPKPVAV